MSGAADGSGGGDGPGGAPGASVTPGPDGTPGASEPYDTGLLPELVARLRGAGLDPDVEQLCDALWLARWTRSADASDEGPDTDPEGRTGTRTSDGPAESARTETRPPGDVRTPDPDTRREETGRTGDGERISLHPVPGRTRTGDGTSAQDPDTARPGTGSAAVLPLGVPAAPVLPAPLELSRALRPLQRYRPVSAPLRRVLDETATAERSARAGGVIMPVFRGSGAATPSCSA